MICPSCGLHNAPESERCECGYDFRNGTHSPKDATPERRRTSSTIGVAALAGMTINLLVLGPLFSLSPLGRSDSMWALGGEALAAFVVFVLVLFFARGSSVPAKGWERSMLVFGGATALTVAWLLLAAISDWVLAAFRAVSPL